MLKRLRHIIVLALLLYSTLQTGAQIAMPDNVCIGTTRTYSVNDPTVPSTYTWMIDGITQISTINSVSITWNTAGTFMVTVQERNAEGCYGDIRAGQVVVNPKTIPLFTQAGPLCLNSTPPALPTTSDNGITGTWSPAIISTANPGPATYTFTPTLGVCAEMTTMDILVNPLPVLVITNPAAVCFGSTVNITLPGITAGSDPGLSLAYWTNASATIPLSNPTAVSTGGTYYISGFNINGCREIKPVVVTIYPAPAASLTGGGIICKGESRTLTLTFTGKAPFNFTYTDGNNATTINGINATTYELIVTPIVSTTYSVTRFGDANCENTNNDLSELVAVVEILQPIRHPVVVASPNVPTQLSIRNVGPDFTYLWEPSVGLNTTTVYNPIFNYDRQTDYYITITSSFGCIVVDSLLVVMLSEAPPLLNTGIHVPKAWTPNGDGRNDRLFPMPVNIFELKYFRIYNRWGQIVFETKSKGQGWDGIFKGQPAALDTYTWVAEMIGIDGRYYKSAGNSILIR